MSAPFQGKAGTPIQKPGEETFQETNEAILSRHKVTGTLGATDGLGDSLDDPLSWDALNFECL